MTAELRLIRLPARQYHDALNDPKAARDAPPKRRLDVFANWDDVLKALEGGSDPGPSALSRAFHGTARVEGVGGSGPQEVAAIARELGAKSDEVLRGEAARYMRDPTDEVEQRRVGWVLEWVGHVREFYGKAAKKREAVVCIFR